MKKLIIILISLISFISCEKEYSTFNNTQTEETNNLGLNVNNYKSVEVSYITIKPENWVTSGEEGSENCYMYAEVECLLITQNVINDGVVLAYYVDADDRDNVLPYIQSYLPEAPSTDVITEIFRFDAEVGKIKFTIQDSDYLFHERLMDIQFKIIVIY